MESLEAYRNSFVTVPLHISQDEERRVLVVLVWTRDNVLFCRFGDKVATVGRWKGAADARRASVDTMWVRAIWLLPEFLGIY